MRKMITLVLLGISLSLTATASEAKCTKDDKEIKCSGADEKEKKLDCEKQGGKWVEDKTASTKEKAKTSGGGGW